MARTKTAAKSTEKPKAPVRARREKKASAQPLPMQVREAVHHLLRLATCLEKPGPTGDDWALRTLQAAVRAADRDLRDRVKRQKRAVAVVTVQAAAEVYRSTGMHQAARPARRRKRQSNVGGVNHRAYC